MISKFALNELGNDYIVGDIHGCFSLLEQELVKLNFNPETDRLFSVGDLIDRGPESIRAIEFLDKPWFHAVLGNHEQMAIDFYEQNETIWVHLQNGGNWILKCLGVLPQLVSKFKQLPLAIEITTKEGLVGIIHSECPVDDWSNLEKYSEDDYFKGLAIWSRDMIKGGRPIVIKNIHKVYHGHTVLEEIHNSGNRVYIDTGAVFPKGKLIIIKI